MKRSISRRLGTVAVSVLTGLALVATAGPAQASSMSFSKSSGRMAQVSWLEVGTLPGVVGNAHVGFMYVEDLGRGRANVFGDVIDFECPEGQLPDGGGHGGHGDEPTEGGCEAVGFRFIDGGDVTFTMDRKLATARLTGTLNVSDHGTPLGSPPVDMTLTGFGDTATGRYTDTFSDGTTTYTYRYTYSQRQAVVTGRIGPMVFDDEAGETSQASMGTFRNASRERTR